MAALPMFFRYHGNYAVFSKKKVVNENQCVVDVCRLVSAPSPLPPFYFEIFFTYAFLLKHCASLTHCAIYCCYSFGICIREGRQREGRG